MTRAKNREVWESRVEDYRNSNLKASEWCDKNDVNLTTLRYWISKLNKEKKTAKKQTGFVEVTHEISQPEQHADAIVIQYRDISIKITQNFDPALLRNVLEVIGAYD